MSTDPEFRDLEEGIGDVVRQFQDDVSPDKINGDMFDLKGLADAKLADLRSFKTMRAEIIKERENLKRRLKVIDKHIEITLSALKTLQTPV